MVRFTKLIAGLGLLAGLLATPASAEYDQAWGGMYGTMGAAGYGWGADMANAFSYMSTGPAGSSYYNASFPGTTSYPYYGGYGGYGSSYGGYGSSYGGYGSSYGGYGGYGYGGYGGYYDNTEYVHVNINVPIYLGGSSCSSSCGYSLYGYNNCGCSSCYSGGSYGTSYPPTYPYTYTSYYPSYPSFNFSPLGYNNGYTDTVVNITTPPIMPPWGGCGNFVQCPTGPTTPVNPVVVTPTYNSTGDPTSGTPVRYRIPRTSEVHGAI
ncbi:hypothetical protein K2X33_07640 [bacterium]|nr:hypothetical protein [bacterium]